jgi:septum formation protein
LGDRVFDKPRDRTQAAEHLRLLRGRTHVLHTAVVVAKDGAALWRHLSAPALTMRAFSDAFATRYLDEAGEAALAGVGAYQVEGRGAQLFESIDGDFFSILGLPLLPLLAFLRQHELAMT